MSLVYLRFLVVALLVVAVQVWVLGSLVLWGAMSLWFYPVLVMFLPMSQSRVSLLWIGFIIGAVIDALMLTPGLHASASTLAFFMRYYCLSLMLDQNMNLSLLPSYGVLQGASILLLAEVILVHHLLLFGLDIGFHYDLAYIGLRLGSSFVGAMLLAILVFLVLSVRLQPRTLSHG